MNDADARWDRVLDELAELIAGQRAIVAAGGRAEAHLLVGLEFHPPGDVPPLPRSRADRARGLLEQTNELIADARAAAASVGSAAAPARPARRPSATMLDTKA